VGRIADVDWKRQSDRAQGRDNHGEKEPDEALVFSDETGEPVGRFRTAWVTAVLKAHGIKPEWKAHSRS
jgi:hypothetical protein